MASLNTQTLQFMNSVTGVKGIFSLLSWKTQIQKKFLWQTREGGNFHNFHFVSSHATFHTVLQLTRIKM